MGTRGGGGLQIGEEGRTTSQILNKYYEVRGKSWRKVLSRTLKKKVAI